MTTPGEAVLRGPARSRAGALALLAVLLAPAALVSPDRHRIRLERRAGEWHVWIDGEPRGRFCEPGSQRFSASRLEVSVPRDRGARVSARVAAEGTERALPPSADRRWRLAPALAGELSVELSLVGAREAAIVLAGDSGDGVRLWLRPAVHHDATFAFLRSGRPAPAHPVGPVGLSLASTALGVVHRLAWIAGPAAWMALAVARLRRPGGSRRPDFLPPSVARGIVALLSVGFFFASLGIERGIFEAMPHVQDSVALLFQARNFALGRLASPLPPEPRFFAHEFVVQKDGLWFGKYFPGASLLYAAAIRAGALDLVNPLLGALSIGLVFALGRRLYGPAEGAIAALLAATSPLLLLQTASYLAHPAALFFLLAFAVALLGEERPGRYALGGLALGAAVLTRPQAAFAVTLPFLPWACRRFVRSPQSRAALLACAAGGALGVGLLGAYDRALTGSVWQTPFQAYSPYDRLGFGAVGVEWPLGFGPAQALSNLRRNLEELGPSLSSLGPPGAALALVPILAGDTSAAARRLAASAACLAGLHFFYFHPGTFLGPRYWYEATPILFVLAARASVEIAEAVSALGIVRAPAAAASLATALLAGGGAAGFAHRLPSYRGWNGIDGRLLAAAERLPGRAVVFVDSRRSWQPYGAAFWTLWPELERNRVIFARHRALDNVHPDAPPLPDECLLRSFPERRAYLWDGRTLVPLEGAAALSDPGAAGAGSRP